MVGGGHRPAAWPGDAVGDGPVRQRSDCPSRRGRASARACTKIDSCWPNSTGRIRQRRPSCGRLLTGGGSAHGDDNTPQCTEGPLASALDRAHGTRGETSGSKTVCCRVCVLSLGAISRLPTSLASEKAWFDREYLAHDYFLASREGAIQGDAFGACSGLLWRSAIAVADPATLVGIGERALSLRAAGDRVRGLDPCL